MKDNYLWDASGEPDPEVQELETILGSLRYQPRPLEIPNEFRVDRRRSFFPAMAIAAAIALAVLLGLWFNFNRRQQVPAIQAGDLRTDKNSTAPLPSVGNGKHTQQIIATMVKSPQAPNPRRESPRNLLARNPNRGTHTQIRQPGLTAEELAKKEQVLVALRLASAKLNFAQRKATGAPQLNTIRNQHKIG